MNDILDIAHESYPSQYGPECQLTVVLVEGIIGDCAAYIGHGDLAWEATHGRKLLLGDACRYFHFPNHLYRS